MGEIESTAMNTEFEEAVRTDDLAVVRQMLDMHPEPLQERSEHGATALMLAVSSFFRSMEGVQLLIDAGAEINAQNDHGYTSLHRVIEVDDGRRPARRQQSWGWTPLMQAVVRGETHEVRALLAAGANPNVFFPPRSQLTFMRGHSLLVASTIADLEVTKLLLAVGADVQARNEHGQTALEHAKQMLRVGKPGEVAREMEEYIRLLREAGAT